MPVPIPAVPYAQGVSAFFQWGSIQPLGQLLGAFSLSDAMQVHMN